MTDSMFWKTKLILSLTLRDHGGGTGLVMVQLSLYCFLVSLYSCLDCNLYGIHDLIPQCDQVG